MGMSGIPAPPALLARVLRVIWPLMAALVTVWLDLQLLLGCWRLRLADPRGTSDTWIEDHEVLMLDVLDTAIRLGRKWVGFEVVLDAPMDLGDPEAPLIALSRHAGPADSVAVAWLLYRTGGRLPRIVLAAALRWDPGIDLILTRLGSSFVPSRTGAGEDRVGRVRGLAASLDEDDALLLFPEGQNWTPHRRRQLIEQLRAAGRWARLRQAERLRHVLPPNPGAWWPPSPNARTRT